ncbi:sodium:solute symporter [Pyrofollis japonicus]|uniref:sodium:solute symporter family protein n=1 Tax=Pyrofollis japonicus TaxID=3060460 RepID=UPI00295B4FCA|nr:hypothetical protein [Pyrofollis japonicus]BEP16667.1 sodium:solute symporter [Pyrofollis japonicus]
MVDATGLITAYLATSLAIGVAVKDRAASLKGFLVANRSMRDWVLAFTFGATYFSSVVMIVGSSWAYAWGPIALIIPLANILVGALLAFIVVGEKVNKLSRRLDALTVPELLAKIHGSKGLQRFLGAIVATGLLLYLVTVASGTAVVMAKALHIGLPVAAAIVAAVLAGYVALGGMYSVILTDVIQGIIMASIVGVLAYASLARLGASSLDATPPLHGVSTLIVFDLAMLTSLAVWGLPQLINRFYTVPSTKAVRRAAGMATMFAFIVALGSFIAGLAARHLASVDKPIDAMPALAGSLLGETGLAVLAAAVLAASMSTADSVALTAASALVYDLAGRKSATAMRVVSAGIVVAATLAAVAVLALPKTVYQAVTAVFKTGWTLTAGAMLVPVLAGVLGDRDPMAAKTAAISGAAMALLVTGLKLALSTGVLAPIRPVVVATELGFTATILVSTLGYITAKTLRARSLS